MKELRFFHEQLYRAFAKLRRPAFLIAMTLMAALSVGAATLPGTELADLSLDALAGIRITSVSRREEALSDAAASVYVITAEAIRRSGVNSLSEAIRLAPNMHVASDNGIPGYISARGANAGVYSSPNKLLMLIDGRSVYTPWFSGIFWDVQDVMLEDIDRIEVISGPAGTLWGINAVNGVINVITRSASNTQGTLVVAGAGNRGAEIGFRHGGMVGDAVHYRVYGKSFSRRNTVNELTGNPVDDAWRKHQVGFRADWERADDQVSVQGNAYTGAEGQPEPGTFRDASNILQRIPWSGANLTARWTRALDHGDSLALQVYYDRTQREIPPVFGDKLDTLDLEFQHLLNLAGGHTVTWGADYRRNWDHVTNSRFFAFLPGHVIQTWASLFGQDEILLRNDLKLTFGTRIERNPYTGVEFLPSTRLAWKISPEHLLWAAASRTVRGPTRLDADTFIPAEPPFRVAGNPDPRSETAKVYELGYRGQRTARASYAVTAFHNIYDHLGTREAAPGGQGGILGSGMDGTATGIEMWGTYQAMPRWRISAGFTALTQRLRRKPNSTDLTATNIAGNDPANTWQIRSSFAIAERQELDVAVRHVASLWNQAVPAYTAVDARFGWQLRPDLELSIVGQNLLGTGHVEFGGPDFRGKIPTEIFFKLVWRH
ncbi:MAG: TonB-dependent receptor [Herminiimonas sp.]|nr:TonB-dependent receptor [Herminiimonas sp.]